MARSRFVDEPGQQVGRALGHMHRILSTVAAGESGTVEMFGSSWTVPRERYFPDIPAIQRYVDEIRSRRWIWTEWPEANMTPVRVIARRGDVEVATMRNGVLSIPDEWDWRRELIVLHELAHHYGNGGHTKIFREALVSLVSHEMSDQLGFILRIALDTDTKFSD